MQGALRQSACLCANLWDALAMVRLDRAWLRKEPGSRTLLGSHHFELRVFLCKHCTKVIHRDESRHEK